MTLPCLAFLSAAALLGPGDCKAPTNATAVQGVRGYNSWPMVQALGARLGALLGPRQDPPPRALPHGGRRRVREGRLAAPRPVPHAGHGHRPRAGARARLAVVRRRLQDGRRERLGPPRERGRRAHVGAADGRGRPLRGGVGDGAVARLAPRRAAPRRRALRAGAQPAVPGHERGRRPDVDEGAHEHRRRGPVDADFIFSRSTAWPEPETLAEGFEPRAYDAGNVNVTRLLGTTDCCAWYTGTTSNATVVVTTVPAPTK